MEITSSITPSKENIIAFNALETGRIAIEAIKKYPVEILIGSVVSLLSLVFSFGVLSGAVSIGYMIYLEKLLIGGEKPSISVIFSKLDKTLPGLVLFILLLVIGWMITLPAVLFGTTVVSLVGLALSGPVFATASIGIYALAKDKTDSGMEALKAGLSTAIQYPIEFVKVGASIYILKLISGSGLFGMICLVFISVLQGLMGYFTGKKVYGE